MRYVQMMLDDDPAPEATNADLQAETINRFSETICRWVFSATVHTCGEQNNPVAKK
ncbi:hypothetical protein B9Z19DRAFT_1124810 [Tuber borchii]|uniref:Uncharacterized protein n=1 Tax=Tuber borchii TaxID=42251 RepID=A0A2T6ZW98_TUBBO|nr:hypothetical protein B9Z19DRAFT_1124810 [Tuber borchii]